MYQPLQFWLWRPCWRLAGRQISAFGPTRQPGISALGCMPGAPPDADGGERKTTARRRLRPELTVIARVGLAAFENRPKWVINRAPAPPRRACTQRSRFERTLETDTGRRDPRRVGNTSAGARVCRNRRDPPGFGGRGGGAAAPMGRAATKEPNRFLRLRFQGPFTLSK